MRTSVRFSGVVLAGALLAGCGTSNVNPFTQTYEDVDGRLIEAARAKEAMKDSPPAPKTGLSEKTLVELRAQTLWNKYPDPRVQAYADNLLDRLVAEWPGERPKQLDVVVTTNPSYFPRVQPTNTILLPVKVLREADTEAQVAAPLAHELGHLLLDHFERTQAEKNRRKLISAAIKMSSIVASQTTNSTVARDIGRYALYAHLAAENALDPQWKRLQEDEADLLGVDLLARRGYRPGAMVEVLQYAKAAKKQNKSQIKQFNKRLKKRMKRAQKNGNIAKSFDIFVNNLNKAFAAAIGDLIAEATQSHPTPESRISNVKQYLNEPENNYKLFLPKPNAKSGEFEAIQKRIEEGVGERYRLANAAAKAAANGELETARRKARKALDGAEHPLHQARIALYHVYREDDWQKAVQQLEIAADAKRPPARVFTSMAKSYQRHGQTEAAYAALEEGTEKLGQPDPFLATRASIAAAAGDRDKVRKALKACREAGGAQFLKNCKQAVSDKKMIPKSMRSQGFFGGGNGGLI